MLEFQNAIPAGLIVSTLSLQLRDAGANIVMPRFPFSL